MGSEGPVHALGINTECLPTGGLTSLEEWMEVGCGEDGGSRKTGQRWLNFFFHLNNGQDNESLACVFYVEYIK